MIIPPPRFLLPPDARLDMETMADGAVIRTLSIERPDADYNMLALNGRADFLEKWADAWDGLASQGLALTGWDWRGQGLSTRLVESGAGHMDRFDRWLDDMDHLGEQAIGRLAGRPWVAAAHSMGGHLLLRWLADPARADHPLRRQLRGVVLMAPFFGLGMAWPVRAAVLAAARREVALGHGERFAPGQGPYGNRAQALARMLLLTGSKERFEDEARWVAANPALATGGVTWGFLNGFAQSMAALNASALEKMDLPVLMLLAGKERLVSNPASLRIARRLPDVQVEVMPNAAHELLREADAARLATLSKIRAFADKVRA